MIYHPTEPPGSPESPKEIPRVIKRMRAKGWRMPSQTIYVGRPTRWQNPFKTLYSYRAWLATGQVEFHDLTGKVLKFELDWWRDRILVNANFLRGFNLACWCIDWDGLGSGPNVCHAEVLLTMANRP